MNDTQQKQLGSTLWAIADKLRGAMNADDFRDYMLSFLFLRYLSDNYEEAVKKELGSDYQKSELEIQKNGEDLDTYIDELKSVITRYSRSLSPKKLGLHEDEEDHQKIEKARQEKKTIIVLAGRPYHVDPEINHGIDKLLMSFNVAIVTEDVIAHKVKQMPAVHVLNQWTYHARLYEAAQYIKNYDDMQLIQLVSFGCGVDAITSDEVRDILERNGKIYTQIKIDEITNLGAVKIRIRSLLAAVGKEKQR